MRLSRWLIVALLATPGAALVAAGCGTGSDADPDAGPGGNGNGDLPDASPPPPPPPPAEYRRGSIAPEFKLMPRNLYGQFEMPAFNNGTAPNDNTFRLANAGDLQDNPGIQVRLQQITQQVNNELDEQGLGAHQIDPLVSTADSGRAQFMPFRGKPSDVELIRIGNQRFALIALGGEIGIPGNEVQILDVTNANNIQNVEILRVGIRPQKIAATREINGIQPGIAFVCNQYSNYISVIDVARGELLGERTGNIVEIETDFQCTDLILADPDPNLLDPEVQDLYVANQWRGSVLKYQLRFVRDQNGNVVDVVRRDPPSGQPNTPTFEYTGVGSNPMRLTLSESGNTIYVSNSRGGDLGYIDRRDDTQRLRTFFDLKGTRLAFPPIQTVDVGLSAFILTTTAHRGFPEENEQLPSVLVADPVVIEGQEVHPGGFRSKTRTYGFEDVGRNQIMQIEGSLQQNTLLEYTSVNEADLRHFDNGNQLVVRGAIGSDMIRGREVGNDVEIWVAWKGSDQVQRFVARRGAANAVNLADGGVLINTDIAPKAIAIDEDEDELFVVNWMSETIQVFNADNGGLIGDFRLRYANPTYPATPVERGEWGWLSAKWSNDGNKSCVSCHLDEMLGDGIPFANGTRVTTMPNQVINNWNLAEAGNYFWNGSFANGSYLSLAFSFQTRGNCELIAFGMVDGLTTDPQERNGILNNNINDADPGAINVDNCRLPDNEDIDFFLREIAPLIGDEKELSNLHIGNVTEQEIGVRLSRAQLAAEIDWYSLAWTRLPPNPTYFLDQRGLLDGEQSQRIAQGRQLFNQAGCNDCHDPAKRFQDNRSHGPGRNFLREFVDTYNGTDLLEDTLGEGFPDTLLNALDLEEAAGDGRAATPNIHLDRIDEFAPVCLRADLCLEFDSPLNATGDEEVRRFELLALVNLADIERGFIPANPIGAGAKINTPSIMGVWWQPNYMRHGLPRTILESIVHPGHSALQPGQIGYAVDRQGNADVHGTTANLSASQLEALIEYVNSIQYAE
jgi:DNA-binding beta-propeller fold protein YncE